MDAASEANLYRMYEKRQHDATRQRPVLPVTIVTGFLGAGKTTLLRKILRSKHNLRIAAVVNEYGTVDHDGGVLERDGQTDSVDKLMGGCVCCHTSLGDELEDKVGELLRRPDHSEDRYDYLVIETSGVSDPESIVRALDKTFGKLTRARLDSVVAVVDADSLLHQLEELEEQEGPQGRGVGEEGSAGGGGGGGGGLGAGLLVSMKRQLENADVILLNKADLVDQQGLSKLSAEVARVNPAARVECCSYGKVPLHSVLDVEAPRTDIQGVSHERVKVHLSVSSKGGNLRTASSSAPSRSGVQKAPASTPEDQRHKGNHGHLREDRLEQVTFTSSVPLSLARFQDWVCYGMPAGVARVKGVLAFDEDRLTRSVFNMSGRRRLSFESDGHWQGPMSLYLVVIGVGIDHAGVLAALEGMRVGNLSLSGGAPAAACEEEATRLLKLLQEDPLFDAVPPEAVPACAPNVVRFRFTGAGAYGIPPFQLSVKFGVNLDAVNRSILRAINNGTAPCRSAAHTEFEPPRPAPSGNAAPSDANGIATGRGGGDSSSGSASAGRDTAAPADAGGKNAAGTVDEKNQRVFLTSQEGVHVSGDQACGGGDQECVALRYAVGGSVSLADAWPLLVERARGVMQSELGHIHFCNCFS